MGRELQKKKNRSGIAKVRMNPRSKKNLILGNAVVAANWDKKQTLSQNYQRLGLATRLNGHTGGVQKKIIHDPETSTQVDRGLDIKTLPKRAVAESSQEVRIERDPATGNILRVIDDETSNANPENPIHKPLSDPLNDLDSTELDEAIRSANQHHNSGHIGKRTVGATEPETEFLKKFEADAARPGGKKVRKQSEREQEWCAELYEKYGQDWNAMFKDQKLNVMQQSEGELKRRVLKWLKDTKGKDTDMVET